MSTRIRIEDRNPDGRGRGYVGKPPNAKTVLVSQAHPGEEIALRLDRKTKGTLQGRVQKLIEPDLRRIRHDCQHEFHCTGCPLLAAHPDEEAGFKMTRVRAALRDAGLPESDEVVQPLVTPVGPFHYRHYAKQVAAVRRGLVVLGSYVAGTHQVVDNSGCPVLVPELVVLLDEVARRATEMRLSVDYARRDGEEQTGLRYVVARQSRATGEQLLVLVTSNEHVDAERDLVDGLLLDSASVSGPKLVGACVLRNLGDGNVLLDGDIVYRVGAAFLVEELAGCRHQIGPTSFFQINPAAAEVLVQRALEDALGGVLDGAAEEGELCLEGFAGVGALTLPLAQRFRKVRAVEASSEAVEHLQRAAAEQGLADRLEVATGKAEVVMPTWLAEAEPSTVVVLDPPRKGLGPRLASALAASRVRRVVLLSCQPSTLAADLPPLRASGFEVIRVTPIDQFPRTGHVETVTLLERPMENGAASGSSVESPVGSPVEEGSRGLSGS